uniref:Uncharacterized protein n=1 Tax=Hucho hucho TaxID=62062 RepID=A0A4W5RV43_9TELE
MEEEKISAQWYTQNLNQHVKQKWNQPRWMGPVQVTMATLTEIRVAERSGWHNLSHCRFLPGWQPSCLEDTEEERG